MRFTSNTILRIAFSFFCVASLANALPAAPDSYSGAKPTSLLGRSYTRRGPDSPVLVSRRRALDSQIQQLDAPSSPLGRVDRFQIAQRRSARAVEGDQEITRAVHAESAGPEAREMLLSHQMAPSAPSATTSSALPLATGPATIPVTTSISLPTPASAAAPGSHTRKAKSKKPKSTKKAKHSEHKKTVVAPAQATGE
ncbi:hypothetical protein C8R46DRAFT_463050 [Mycena filopes]|nr:hypothetical protein C8R46DRAFT_463050 [Mycena filopes]